MAISTGPRPRAQLWARAIYDAYPNLQGIYYPSSMHANRPSVALFERSTGALPTAPAVHRALLDPALLGALRRAASTLGYGLV